MPGRIPMASHLAQEHLSQGTLPVPRLFWAVIIDLSLIYGIKAYRGEGEDDLYRIPVRKPSQARGPPSAKLLPYPAFTFQLSARQ
jgi:hypothetical protein